MVPQEGFEPPTHALRMRCSTPELLRLSCTTSSDTPKTDEPLSPLTAQEGEAVERASFRHGIFLAYTMSLLGRNLPWRARLRHAERSLALQSPISSSSRHI